MLVLKPKIMLTALEQPLMQLYGKPELFFVEPIEESFVKKEKRKGVILPPHTFDAPIYELKIPLGLWRSYENLKNTHPERKWYMIVKALDNNRPNDFIGFLTVHDSIGPYAEVSANRRIIKMLNRLTSEDVSTNIVPGHAHPGEGISHGDMRTMRDIYRVSDEEINVFMIVCPQSVRLYEIESHGKRYRIHRMVPGTEFQVVTTPYHQSPTTMYLASRIIGTLKEQNNISTQEALSIIKKW